MTLNYLGGNINLSNKKNILIILILFINYQYWKKEETDQYI